MITSITNQQVKNIKKLLKSSKERNRQGVFVVEGIRMFREVPKEDLAAVFVTEEFARKNQDIFAVMEIEPSFSKPLLSLSLKIRLDSSRGRLKLLALRFYVFQNGPFWLAFVVQPSDTSCLLVLRLHRVCIWQQSTSLLIFLAFSVLTC